MTTQIRGTADMEEVVRDILDEVYGQGRLELLDEVCAHDYRSHDAFTGDADLAGTLEVIRFYRSAFPDLATECLALFGEKDRVVCHWRFTGTHEGPFLGVPPTGQRCTVEGITISRFAGGKLAEDWSYWDSLGLLQQVGLVATTEDLIDEATEKYAASPEHRPTV